MPRFAIHLLLLTLAATGCDKPAPATAATNPGNPPAVAKTLGAIRGKVLLTGYKLPPPAATMVKCGDHQVPITDETVLLNPDGTLRNVIVYIKNAPPNASTGLAAPAVLDQVNCVYKPHVVAIQAGQGIRFKSSDNILHNVHPLPEFNTGLNFGMNGPGQRVVTFNKAETFRVRCDVHPWMNAWVAVFAHPWFAITADGGAFDIKNIPTGTYTLVAWHERFGELEQTINVSDEAREITFTFKPPDEK
jgi:plastocyanin